MQKLLITTKDADFEQKKYVEKIFTAVVASTKSQNNFIDDLKQQGRNVSSVKVEEIFLDKGKVRSGVEDFVSEQISNPDIAFSIVNHIMKALDGACVFKKPPIVRKK